MVLPAITRPDRLVIAYKAYGIRPYLVYWAIEDYWPTASSPA